MTTKFEQFNGVGGTNINANNKKSIKDGMDDKLAGHDLTDPSIPEEWLFRYAVKRGVTVDGVKLEYGSTPVRAESLRRARAAGRAKVLAAIIADHQANNLPLLSPVGEGNPFVWSKVRKSDLAAGGAPLSAAEEKAEANVMGSEFVPFIRGEAANVINRDHAWIKEAATRQMRIVAGISGTTNRLMNAAQLCGVSDQELKHVRNAILGFLLPIEAHSFHEIMSAANGHPGCDYTPGPRAYRNIQGLERDMSPYPDEVFFQ
jgi:hypothetical protein